MRNLIPYIGGLDRMSFVFGMYVNHRERLKDFIKALGDGSSCYTDALGYAWDTDFIKNLGLLPNPHVRHFIDQKETYAEYAKRMEQHIIKAETARQREREILNLCSSRQWRRLHETLDKHGRHDTCHLAIGLMDDMFNDNKTYHVVNTVNEGFIPDLPNGSAVEITARITKHGPIPVYIGRLPDAVRGMVQRVKSSEHLLVDAICEHDLAKARFAAQMHPLTTSIQDAGRAFDALLDAHSEHLTYYGEDKVCD
jgi:6-phospho-beta-glucosidase